jgi:two-component system sensor histidine kinase/response regulator
MFLFRCFTFRLVRLRAPRAWSRAALLIALAFCLTGPGAALAAAPARAPERLRVVLPKDYPPFVQEDERGVLQGVLVDVWRLWEKRTGALVELTAMEWPKAQQAVLSGEADVIDSIFFSPEREALYDFSKPSFPMNVTVFVRSGTHVVKNVDELKTRTVGVSAGDACIHLLKAQGVA